MSIHRLSMKIVSLVFCAVLAAGAAAFSQVQPGTPPGPQAMPGDPSPGMQGMREPGSMEPNTDTQATQAMEDRDFVKTALQGGMAQVQLGQLAARKGSSEDVRSFGQKMVDDHTRLGNEMSQVAQGVGVTPPQGLSKKDKEVLAKLRGLSGSQFDDTYIRIMVKDHKKDKDAFKVEAERAEIPAVKQAAAQGERVIAGQLQRIEQIAQAHDLNGGKSSSAGLE